SRAALPRTRAPPQTPLPSDEPTMNRQSEHSSMSDVSVDISTIEGETSTPSTPFWNMTTAWGMRLLQAMLQRIIRKGALAVLSPDGRTYRVGNGTPSVAIRIEDPAIILRLLLNPDLVLGEAYTDGVLTVERGEIYDVLDLCFSNLGWNTRLRSAWSAA